MFLFVRKYFSPFVHQDEELSFLQIFKPMYYLVSAVGLFPSSIKFPTGKTLTVVYKSTTINLACTLLMATTVCVSFSLHMLELSINGRQELNNFEEDDITLTNYITNLVLMLIFSVIAFISALKNRSLYIKILNEMAECWAVLPNSVGSNGILGPLRVQVNCVVLGSLLLMLIVQLVVTCTADLPKSKIALIAMTFNLPEMLQFTVLAFYFVMIVMPVAILKNIEEHFGMIFDVRRVCDVENDFVGLPLGSSLASLRQLRGVYARALAVKRQVNAAFQAPLLLITALSFHTIVTVAHGIYHVLTYQNNFTTHDVVEECFWVVYQLIKFHTLGYSSALLELQANKIGSTLYKISTHINEQITQYKSSADVNKEIKFNLEVQHFASMMKYQDTKITIYGLFPLKSSLLFTAVASAASFIVILVQFDDGK
uniref:Gustatory receptor n=1 Tax=Epiphyas postvittana TaxID=65032 RepID=A0A0K8TUH2_EPIPO